MTNYQVDNYGLIRGDYAGEGNIVDRSGAASIDGDGDGVDIDGAATIINRATGIIKGTGAGGFDSGGRTNGSDGIAIGGGVITNSGIIEGANNGIIVNNDTVASRSGVAATTINNNVGATITGLNGFAIRLENKLGTAADNDTIINNGTITGNGTIPNPSATVNRQYGEADVNSVGTLDGVNYTGTGSARFIRGDGAAIQTGEGNDSVTNSGAITGNTGRAISLEGGNDTLTVTGGSAAINGDVDGGAGSDTLDLNLGSSSNTFSYSGAIKNFEAVNVISGSTLLAGNSTYEGTTTVSGGSLTIDGNHSGTGVVNVTSGGTFGGDGTLAGNLSLNAGAKFIFEIGSTLTINGGTVTFGGFSISDLVGLSSSTSNGTYTLINGAATIDFTNINNMGVANAASLGGGKTAYFQQGSLQVTVVPEPSVIGLVAMAGSLLTLMARRKRQA